MHRFERRSWHFNISPWAHSVWESMFNTQFSNYRSFKHDVGCVPQCCVDRHVHIVVVVYVWMLCMVLGPIEVVDCMFAS
jgi:hypothetical protein